MSKSEGFSISILEALAAGVPVLITKACNFDDVDKFGAGVVLLGEDLISEVSNSLSKLVKKPEQLRKMGKNAKILVARHYSIAKMAEKIERVYEVFT